MVIYIKIVGAQSMNDLSVKLQNNHVKGSNKFHETSRSQ